MDIPLIVDVDGIGESPDRSRCTVFDPSPKEVTHPAIKIEGLFNNGRYLQSVDRIHDNIPETIRLGRSPQDLEELLPFARAEYIDLGDVGYFQAAATREAKTAVFWPYITQTAGQEALFGGLKL